MRKFAVWSSWLDGGMRGKETAMGAAMILIMRTLMTVALSMCMFMTGSTRAQTPPDVVISTPEEARAFNDPAPFLFAGQSLTVATSFATDRAFVLEKRARLRVGEGVYFALNGTVASEARSTEAPFEKWGLGTLALSGANTYTGGTLLYEGTLDLHGAAPLGAAAYNLQQSGGTALRFADGAWVANHIRLVPAVATAQPLPGLSGLTEWHVASGEATIVATVNAFVPVRKTGAGSLRLRGVYTGGLPMWLQEGALVLDTDFSGRVHVGSGARLEGVGPVLGMTVRSGGMLAPGGRGAPATFTSWADSSFEPGSIYHVNVFSDGRSDLLDCLCTLQLGGVVEVDAAEGGWGAEHRILIVKADGGLSDTAFDAVRINLPTLDPSLEYSGNEVYLLIRLADPAGNDEPTVPGVPEHPGIPPERPRIPVINPWVKDAWHASMHSFLMGNSRYVREAVLASARGDHTAAVSERGGDLSAGADPGADQGAGASRGTGVADTWAYAFGATGKRGPAADVAGDRHDTRGIVLGLNAPLAPNWKLGGVLAAQHAKLERDGSRASANVDSLHVGLTARGRTPAWRITTGLLRAWHRIESRRRAQGGPLQSLLGATYTGKSWQAFMEVAPRLRQFTDWAKRFNEESGPYLRHTWMHLKTPDFAERGGADALSVRASSAHMHTSTLGWRMRHEGKWQGRGLKLEADVGWQHVWSSASPVVAQRLRTDAAHRTPTHSVTGLPMPRNTVTLDLGAGLAIRKNALLALRYSGVHGSGYRDHAGWAEFQWAF